MSSVIVFSSVSSTCAAFNVMFALVMVFIILSPTMLIVFEIFRKESPSLISWESQEKCLSEMFCLPLGDSPDMASPCAFGLPCFFSTAPSSSLHASVDSFGI